jgi:phenylacetate-CoA ligase
MCILAYDKYKNNNYKPFLTYGYAEVENHFLIGTSFNNLDMPLIRYNTQDIVIPTINNNGLLDSFKISEGRIGDFVYDKEEKRIPLTGLIYGRHHKIFNVADHIQVSQKENGKCTIFLSIRNNKMASEQLNNMIDFSNVNIEYKIHVIDSPILTSSGKLKLKID